MWSYHKKSFSLFLVLFCAATLFLQSFACAENTQKILQTKSTELSVEKEEPSEVGKAFVSAKVFLEALEAATEDLKNHAEFRLQSLSEAEYEALASMVYPITIKTTYRELHSHDAIKATATLYDALNKKPEYIQKLYTDFLQIPLRTQALKSLKGLIEQSRLVAHNDRIALFEIARHLQALLTYMQEISTSFPLFEKSEEDFSLLKDLHNEAPHEPLIAMSLAELYMQNNAPFEALQAIDITLNALPKLSYAHYVQGLINVQLEQPALALDDFDKAVHLDKDTALFWRAKATAHALLHEREFMCEAFFQACYLGDCQGLANARKVDMCLKAQ